MYLNKNSSDLVFGAKSRPSRVPSVFVPVPPPVPHSRHHSFIGSLSSSTSAPTLFFSKSVLATLVPLLFNINFRIRLSVATKKPAEVPVGIVFLYTNRSTWGDLTS